MSQQYVPGSYEPPVRGTNASDTILIMDDPMKNREGKFESLETFLRADEGLLAKLKNSYRKASEAEIHAGYIIHVKEENPSTPESRIHNRIFVVKAAHSSSMTCYTFCWHQLGLLGPECERHWQVANGNGSNAAASSTTTAISPRSLQSLPISLIRGVSARSEITLNIRDPWHVEKNVLVAILGEVSGQTWVNVRRAMNDMFTKDSRQLRQIATTEVIPEVPGSAPPMATSASAPPRPTRPAEETRPRRPSGHQSRPLRGLWG